MQYRIHTNKGGRGKWRWYAYDEDDGLLCQGPVTGHSSYVEAEIMGHHIMRNAWRQAEEEETKEGER